MVEQASLAYIEHKPIRHMYELENFVPNSKKILFLLADLNGCGWYRGRTPASFLNMKYSDYINIVVSNCILKEDIEKDHPNHISWDMIVLQRQTSDMVLNLLYKFKQEKIILVYELDDDLFKIHPTSPVAKAYTPDTLKNIYEFLRKVDAVTVSTEPLKKVLNHLHDNIHVLPNFVNTDFMKTLRKKKEDYYRNDPIIIGWAGSSTHYIDLKVVVSVIKDILKIHKNVKFYLGGWSDCPLFKDINPDQIIYGSWYNNVLDYYRSLQKVDIAICPLAPIAFNESKSNIKYLEFASLGIPVIASSVYPYQNTIEDRKTGILVKTSGNTYKAWRNAIEELIENPKFRHTLGVNGSQFVDNNFDQKIIGQKWFAFYRNLLTQKGG
jgi:glycosyltransferase involved in cell wall biosynthesis